MLKSGYYIEKTAKRMKQSFARTLSNANALVTVDQWVVLEQLETSEGYSQLELAKLTYKDAPTITRIIDLLEKKNLVNRDPNKDDRRKFRISLTEDGINEVKKIKKIALTFRKQLYDGLNIKEVDLLMNMLEIINSNLK